MEDFEKLFMGHEKLSFGGYPEGVGHNSMSPGKLKNACHAVLTNIWQDMDFFHSSPTTLRFRDETIKINFLSHEKLHRRRYIISLYIESFPFQANWPDTDQKHLYL